jgi:hypothetical protein
MKRTIAILSVGIALCGLLSVAITGCATDPAIIAYNSEATLVDSATAATHVFNQTYPSNSTPSVAAARTTLYTLDTNLSLSLTVVDALRTNYVATGETNVNLMAAITAALATVAAETSTITNLVNSVK